MAMALNPVQIYKAGANEERAETARLSSFVGAIAVGDLVKSTLGPKGMDKILLNPQGASRGEPLVTVTNDGATILRCFLENLEVRKIFDIILIHTCPYF